MKFENLMNANKIFFIGIGGISMSGLAKLLKSYNINILGADSRESNNTIDLINHNIDVIYGQKSENITKDIDYIVYTSAIKDDNPELVRARELGITILKRIELIALLTNGHKYSVAISGTHGKTSTTSFVSHIMEELDPTISIGGILESIGGNVRVGKSDYFVTEACEYMDNFLYLNPYASIILNIEEDHLDYFKDLSHIQDSFKKFSTQTSEILIVNENIKHLFNHKNLITFGFDNADYIAENIKFKNGYTSFDIISSNRKLFNISIKTFGNHNVLNALASIALALELGIEVTTIKEGLSSFKCANRRLEYKGTYKDAIIYDDYAHHPTEIRTSLNAYKAFERKVICIFQPHTYSRTKSFMKDFAKSLCHCDEVIIPKIYAARETDTLGISSKDLVKEIEKLNGNVRYIPEFDDIIEHLTEENLTDTLIITMGAGDIFKVGEKLVNML
jgi:UDP-N-acetylmuramate--alanine ligase